MGFPRNRWILAAGVTGTAVAVVVTGAVAASAAQEPPAPPVAVSSRPVAPAPAQTQPAQRRLGKVIDAGFAAKQGDWVIYAVPVEEKVLPGTHFGVMAGRRLPGGSIVDVVVANETEGSDRAPGFHAVQGGMELDGEQSPSFGYYVGDAAKITARAGGRTVVARQAAWSEDAAVTFFWFDPRTKPVSDLKAFDSAGRALTTGHNGVGVG